MLGRGGEVGDAVFAARVKPLLDIKPAYDKYDKAIAAAQQEGLRAGEAARERGGDAAAEGSALPSDARRDCARGEGSAEGHPVLREGDVARSELLRVVPRRRRCAVPRGQQEQGGGVAREECGAAAHRARRIFPRRAGARAWGYAEGPEVLPGRRVIAERDRPGRGRRVRAPGSAAESVELRRRHAGS